MSIRTFRWLLAMWTSVAAAQPIPADVVAADIDGNGTLDMIAALPSLGALSVRLVHLDGSIAAAHRVAVSGRPTSLAAADVTGDGKHDIIVLCPDDKRVRVISVSLHGQLEVVRELKTEGGTDRVIVGDLNGDALVDIVVVRSRARSLKLFWGTEGGDLREGGFIKLSLPPDRVSVYDVYGDGKLDIVASKANDDTVTVYQLEGRSDWKRSVHDINVSPNDFALGDVDGDGRTDLVAADRKAGTIVVRRSAFQDVPVQQSYSVPAGAFSVAVEDIFPLVEGHEIVVHCNDGTVRIGKSGGSQWFSFRYPAAPNAIQVRAFDLNRDGRGEVLSWNVDGLSYLSVIEGDEVTATPFAF
jgi:hypothetical protein